MNYRNNKKNRRRGSQTSRKNIKKTMNDNKDYKETEQNLAAEESQAEEAVIDGDYAGQAEDTQAEQEVNTLENQVVELQAQVDKEKKEYLFLAAEFDNYRKRTLREKAEIIKNGGENVLKGLLPIVDDFERGLKAADTDSDSKAVLEGMTLIYNKLIKFLESMGVKEMASTGEPFNSDLHEAIAQVPAPTEDMKGKVLDTVQKGYLINDKVLRHAKVAVAQ